MKVSRQNLTESYSTTADWVSDFQRGITKESDYLDNLKNILNKRKDFSTIEEKMADIRTRAGFDLVKNLKSENLNVKEAGSCTSCGDKGESCKPCSKDGGDRAFREMIITKVVNLLAHLKQRHNHLSKNRKDNKGIDSIIFYCRNSNADLGFYEIESAIPIGDLKEIISDYLELSANIEDCDEEFQEKAVPYVPEECESSDEPDDKTAEYFRHALTSG